MGTLQPHITEIHKFQNQFGRKYTNQTDDLMNNEANFQRYTFCMGQLDIEAIECAKFWN